MVKFVSNSSGKFPQRLGTEMTLHDLEQPSLLKSCQHSDMLHYLLDEAFQLTKRMTDSWLLG